MVGIQIRTRLCAPQATVAPTQLQDRFWKKIKQNSGLRMHPLGQGCTNFPPDFWWSTQNLRRQNVDKKQVSYWGPVVLGTNVWNLAATGTRRPQLAHPCRRLYLWLVGLCVSYVNKDTGYPDRRSLVNSLNLPRQIVEYKLTREHDRFLSNTECFHYGTVICLRIISVIIASLNKLNVPSRPVCFIPPSNSRHHPLVHSRHACAVL